MKKRTKRLLAGMLAAVFMLSSVSFGTITVHAEEATSTKTQTETSTSETPIETTGGQTNGETINQEVTPTTDLNQSSNLQTTQETTQTSVQQSSETINTTSTQTPDQSTIQTVSSNEVQENKEQTQPVVTNTVDTSVASTTASGEGTTYSFDSLSVESGGPSIGETVDGVTEITFNGNYASVFVKVPSELAGLAIEKITFNITSGNTDWFAFKSYTEETYADKWASQTDLLYRNAVMTPAEETNGELTYLAIMSCYPEGLTDEEKPETVTMSISGISFECGEAKEPIQEEKPEGNTDGTYTLAQLGAASTSDVTVSEAENEDTKLTFAGNWKTLFMAVPAELSGLAIDKITFNVTSDNAGSFGYKTFTQEQYDTDPWSAQTDVSYGNTTINPAGDTKADLKYIAITSNFSSDPSDEVIEMTISGITFATSEVVDDGNVEKVEVVYNFKDLENVNSYGVTLTVGDGGELKAEYNGQYQETFYKVPDAIDPAKVKKVDLLLTDGSNVTIKLYPTATGSGDPQVNYSNSISPSGEFLSFGIMNLAEGTNTIKASGVKFTVADSLENVEIKKTYNFNDLSEAKNGGVAKSVDSSTGALTLGYTSNYQEVFFEVPKEIDTSRVHKVTFNSSSENTGVTAYKFYTEDGFSGDWPSTNKVSYGNPVVTVNSDNLDNFDATRYFGLMSCRNIPQDESWTAEDNYSITFDSVTFHTSGWGYTEEAEEDTNVTYGDNIIKNPNFAEENLSMWTMGTSKSVISGEVADKAIFDEVATYGKIDRDASWSIPAEGDQKEQDARHEFFAQDITDAIAADGDLNRRAEYKVEFYAMLSDDYKDAPADQRVVEFAPYIITEQGDHEYLGVSYSSQLSGNLSQELEAGKWTKFSGTFSVSHSGTIKQVVIRIIEQGTGYGDIAAGAECVKGDFYITGVSMTEIFKPETTIETDIPNWKDAITSAFGKDAIAGTCLGRGTITYEYLQELAKKHFNAITFENEQKPDITLGSTPNIGADGYPILNFNAADTMMAQIKGWNDEDPNDGINFKIRGHVLVWHSQTPEWFFHEDYDTSKDFVTPEVMNLRLEHYIKSVFEHYNNVTFEDGSTAAEMFYGWDVVNEAISDSTGNPRKASDNSNWARVYGDESNEYIINAFRYANKYAPAYIKLFYNDYNDSNEPKASGIAKLAAEITAHENDATYPTRIDGIGMQAHHNFADPTVSQIKSAINKYLDALGKGGTVQMTEFDVKKSSTFDGTAATLEAEHNKQAWRFKEIFDAYRDITTERPGSVSGITMWGITDETSWLQSNNTVGGASSGGAQAPLLFYIDNFVAKAKPAFYAFFDEYEENLAPMIQSVTVMQQMKEDNFDIGLSYGVAGTFDFVPMWTNEGLTIKISVTDDTDNGANDKVTVYIDEANSKAEGNFAKVTVARNAAGVTSTASGYETIVTIPMATGSAKTFSMDVAVDNNGTVSVFNDKKGGQDSSSEYYADAIMKPYAEINKGTVTVDGEADAAWANVDAIPLTIVLGAEASATVKALWDAENLYVYAEVKDPDLDATASADHEKDSLEVFIDENNAKAESYQVDDKQYRVNYLNEQTFNGTKCVAENIVSAVKETSDGYVLEVAYKWTDITPANGKEIGIEFQINDAKGGARIDTASWYDTSGQGYQNPSVFGTALLVDGTSTPDTPSEGGNTKPESGSSSDSGSSSSGSSSSGSSSDKDSSSSEETTTPEETPTTPSTPSTPATPETGDDDDDTTVEEDTTSTLETIIPEAVETVVEQLQTLVDEDATFEEKVEAVQEVIDTVIEVVINEEVQELAKEAITSIEQKIKDALGIDTEVECKGKDVPEVKSVIGALLSVDAGKQPKLKVEAKDKGKTAELEELDEGLINGFPLDIKLLADDEEVQPNVPITIRMGIPKGIDKDKEIKVVHFGKNGKNMLDVALFGEEMEFTTDGFSTFVVVNVESATAGTELAPADDATAEVTDTENAVSSAVEEKAEDNGFTTFIIIVIVVAVLALAAVGFFVFKNKKEE